MGRSNIQFLAYYIQILNYKNKIFIFLFNFLNKTGQKLTLGPTHSHSYLFNNFEIITMSLHFQRSGNYLELEYSKANNSFIEHQLNN